MEALELAGVAWKPKPAATLRLADLEKRFNWTSDAQATEAIERLGCPGGRIVSAMRGYAAWEESVRRVFPNALGKR